MVPCPAASHTLRVFASVLLEREDQPLLFSSNNSRAIAAAQAGTQLESSEVLPRVGADLADANATGAR
ncbi:MAG TPA: hypothetical protein VFT72_06645 [Opitutaceae bacterium]|nr:hypothetical protein [Opitutaceae bacterium]